MRIAIVHYAASPIIGGVERVIEQQAKVLSDHGHEVVVICGNEGAAVATAEMRILSSLKANVALDERAGEQLVEDLSETLKGAEVVLVHNMFTMPFNWMASKVLARLSREMTGSRFVNWVHDVDVSKEAFTGLDARLVHVVVSEVRRQHFIDRLGVPGADSRIIPNGVEVTEALGLTPSVANFVQRTEVLDRELVLVHPTRVLARKNIEMGLAVTAALRDAGCDVAYLVTGAPDPHRKESAAYAERITEAISQFGLEDRVHFLSRDFSVTNADVASLYRLADALIFPSRSEGFGLPLVEAVLHRLPVFCSDIPPHREVAGDFAVFFDLASPPAEVARLVLESVGSDHCSTVRKTVMRRFGWKHIFKEYLEPLIKER